MKILLAIDESHSSEDAVREVEQRFAPSDVSVRVLHVVAKFVPPAAALLDAGGSPEAARAEVVNRFRAVVERAVERLKARGLAVEGIVKDGNPGKVIVREAKEWDADLIVIGAASHGKLHSIVTGNIPQYVFDHAPCSVEIVHERNQIPMSEKKRVLILCTGNSARSQMAEGLLRKDAGDSFEVLSAGVEPTQVKTEAIQVMREAGIDISGQRSKSVDEFAGQEFDYVITVCDNANERCPIFPGDTKRIHWSFDDPAAAEGDIEARLAVFRRVRNEIRQRLRLFAAATTNRTG